MGCNVASTFPLYPAHTAVLSMDCQTGIVSIYTEDDKDAFLTRAAASSTTRAPPA
jgi:hypothetical protein